MALTTAQKAALLADIQGDGAALALFTGPTQDLTALAAMYNTDASPDHKIWKPSVSVTEMKRAIVWTEFVALTDLKMQAYFALTAGGTIEPTVPSIRTALNQVFSTATASRDALIALAQRNATRAEKVLATGDGVGSVADPDTPTFTGSLSYTDFLGLE